MNNAKVRIYDLSKELNIDNKEILDICEQLNIPVKSHSSTISESQAERIKSRIDKLIANQVAERSAVKTAKGKGEGKQQILAIHHKQLRPLSDSTRESASAPVLMAPSRPPAKPQPSLVSSSPVGDSPPIESRTAATPELTQPPAAAKAHAPVSKPSVKLAEKPVVQTSAALQAPSSPEATSVTIAIADTATPLLSDAKAARNTDRPSEVAAGRKEGKKVAKIKSLPDLHRPHSPQLDKTEVLSLVGRPAKLDLEKGEKREEGDEEVSLEGDTKEKPQLKRPVPPRPSKRQQWEEEEEEERAAKNKVAKTTGKAKRRSQLLEDEDEEVFGTDAEGSSLATSVSLSTARPPKPKSQNKPSVATTVKPKKPTVKTDSSQVRSKAERRSRKDEVQRADKIMLDSNLTVRDLAERLNVPETEVIKNLFFKGMAVNITQTLDLETAQMVSRELGVEIEASPEAEAAAKKTEMLNAEDLEHLHRRPPVVTIMGHVDHGKTTLLDSIRKTKVAQGEAGGITQHIGAYHVDIEHNGEPQQIVFLDTPGHEAFTAMRARGARVTDIAVLVVAADDGVQPQTREAISHAKAAEVPIVVAINKIDKPDANPDRIKQELSDLGLLPEEWGGQTIMVPVSALKGENLDTLLEMILLVSEVEELSANPNRLGKGTVIEANLDRSKGPVATLLVQNGTLRVGDIIVAGSVFGKIRAMIDDRGQKVEAATPSFAVEVLGLNDVPAAGEEFNAHTNEKEARLVAEAQAETRRQSRLQQAISSRRVTLSSLSAQAQEGELKELNLILKADVQGSLEAIINALGQLPQDEVQIRVLLSAPGEITETDVDLASASGAVIVGFNTTLASGARAAADQAGVDIREYDIIYKLLDDIQGAMEGLLDPEEIEVPLGQVEVRAVFAVGRGAVAGCYVQSGKIVRNRSLRVRRGGQVIYQGTLDSLKRIKEDAREVNAGYECGIGVDKFNDWAEGDLIEVYEMQVKRRTLAGR